MTAVGRILVATPLKMDASLGLPQAMMRPTITPTLHLHAKNVILVPVQGPTELIRCQELVVAVHPEYVVRSARLDLPDEDVARLAEVPDLPVACLVLPRGVRVRLRKDR